eukprot:5651813-Amphidinium_carterae.2
MSNLGAHWVTLLDSPGTPRTLPPGDGDDGFGISNQASPGLTQEWHAVLFSSNFDHESAFVQSRLHTGL